MRRRAQVDSRQYIIAYAVPSIAECPSDFSLPAGLEHFKAGVFLPRDDPDWFGRSSYPPRLLVLTSDTVCIVPHPDSNGESSNFRIDDICFVASGHFLLKGWLRFAGRGSDCTLPYNTRGLPSVQEFMQRLREVLLEEAPGFPAPGTRLGADLDIKFSNAVIRELDRSESRVAVFFQPPEDLRSSQWFTARRSRAPGDVLVLTPGRLLWITDRDRGSHSRFGSVASYAPLRALRAIGFGPDRNDPVLQVSLQGDRGWDIPIRRKNLEDAEAFVALANIQKNRYEEVRFRDF